MTDTFASSGDTAAKEETFVELADGVYALTAEGDPNVGAIEAEDFLICFEARATPVAAERWLARLRERTEKPVRYLVLSHYHAVRVLGASAFGAQEIITHEATAELIEERGEADWLSEYGRMPRLFEEPSSIPGLTRPSLTFSGRLSIPLGGDRGDLVLVHCGRGHTSGDLVAWLPRHGVLFAGDLVEAQAALYTGDAHHDDWASSTLDTVASFGATALVGGRGAVAKGEREVRAAIAQTRHFLDLLRDAVGAVHRKRGSTAEAFQAAHAALAPEYGRWPIFEHCLPFDVQRYWDELNGVDMPKVWTAERDREVWAELRGEQ
ncbi:MBL fold metallo-hydrolase [Amycolatopsis nigrescens]|uniref:MBL fold metallo-hydrolase n=1 Tax=Amycolatopsis nigrescens TaxID=381445 RepID=UPI0003807A1E|nr:MBL fold metallo-hydrolase [Amycolatopsis nigrescens]